MTDKELIAAAEKMRDSAYAPYSGFTVGAALLSKDGRVFTGCNIENAAYSAANCAERTAFFKAVSEGALKFEKIAVATGPKGKPSEGGAPCGVCRQVMLEFCEPDFEIILVSDENSVSYTLEELIPHGFSPKDLNNV